jgi:hypothetical protein
VIKQQKGVYLKFLMIPLLIQLFYILSFTTSNSNLTFLRDGLVYANQTSSGKRIFYHGLSYMQ